MMFTPEREAEIIEGLMKVLTACREAPIVMLFAGPIQDDHPVFVQGEELYRPPDDVPEEEIVDRLFSGKNQTRMVFGVKEPEMVAEKLRMLRDALADGPLTPERIKFAMMAPDASA